jgi:hypothetical protein
MMSWEEVHIDLIGPWAIKIGEQNIEFNALTCIDPVTNLVELVRIDNKTLNHIQQLFQNHWFSRYLWPTKCVHNNGGEFTGWKFQRLLEQTGIQDRATTSRNPQSNAICERMHQTVGNVLRTLLHGNIVNNNEQANTIIDNALATAMHITRSATSRTLGNNSPGALAFHRHMFLNLPFQADLQASSTTKKTVICGRKSTETKRKTTTI